MNYEYVPRKEYALWRDWIEKTYLPVFHSAIKEKLSIKFQHRLVGSGKNKLVTRKDNGYFDLDYLFLFKKNEVTTSTIPDLKNQIMDILNKSIKEENKHVDDSTSVITVRWTNPEKSTRIISMDLALGYEDTDGTYILIHDKNNDSYHYDPSSPLMRTD